MQLFGDDRIDWIRSQSWRRQIIDQNGIHCLNGAWRHGIAESDIDLCLAACLGDLGGDQYPSTGIPGLLSDLFHADRCRIEDNAILDLDAGDVPEGLGDRVEITGAEAEQVRVAGGAVRHVVPEGEEQRTLEQEAIGMGRHAKPVQHALQCKPHQNLVEVGALQFGHRQQASPNGSGEIFFHSIASR